MPGTFNNVYHVPFAVTPDDLAAGVYTEWAVTDRDGLAERQFEPAVIPAEGRALGVPHDRVTLTPPLDDWRFASAAFTSVLAFSSASVTDFANSVAIVALALGDKSSL